MKFLIYSRCAQKFADDVEIAVKDDGSDDYDNRD